MVRLSKPHDFDTFLSDLKTSYVMVRHSVFVSNATIRPDLKTSYVMVRLKRGMAYIDNVADLKTSYVMVRRHFININSFCCII